MVSGAENMKCTFPSHAGIEHCVIYRDSAIRRGEHKRSPVGADFHRIPQSAIGFRQRVDKRNAGRILVIEMARDKHIATIVHQCQARTVVPIPHRGLQASLDEHIILASRREEVAPEAHRLQVQ